MFPTADDQKIRSHFVWEAGSSENYSVTDVDKNAPTVNRVVPKLRARRIEVPPCVTPVELAAMLLPITQASRGA